MSLFIDRLEADSAQSAPRKVHVGCGPTALIEGWHNTDLRPFPGVDSAMDATQPWPFSELTHVFGEHFIEHLAIDQALRFLIHAGNALAPGGRIRLSTPNLAWVMATCFDPAPSSLQRRLDDTITINRGFYGWGHQFLWSEEMLRFVMESVGYECVASFAYGESDDPELASLERHGRNSIDGGLSSVVILEGVRGELPLAAAPAVDAWFERELLCHVRAGH
jgi:predicted SAM-dependent methyltransferase